MSREALLAVIIVEIVNRLSSDIVSSERIRLPTSSNNY